MTAWPIMRSLAPGFRNQHMCIKHPPATDPHKLFPCEVVKPTWHITPPPTRPFRQNCFRQKVFFFEDIMFYFKDKRGILKMCGQFMCSQFIAVNVLVEHGFKYKGLTQITNLPEKRKLSKNNRMNEEWRYFTYLW